MNNFLGFFKMRKARADFWALAFRNRILFRSRCFCLVDFADDHQITFFVCIDK